MKIFLLADDIHGFRDIPNVNHFQKSDKFVLEVSADVFGTLAVSAMYLLNLFETLAVVSERPALPKRGFIVQILNPSDEIVIKCYRPNNYAFPSCTM